MSSFSGQTHPLEEATIGIVTALPKELAAVQLVFDCDQTLPVAVPRSRIHSSYHIARISSVTGGSHVVAISLLTEMGNNQSTAAAVRMTYECPNVNLILMVGIAGAIPNPAKPEDHVRLGDIVVSSASGAVQYDFGKQNSSAEFVYRATQTRPAPALIHCVRRLQAAAELGTYPWEQHIAHAVSRNGNFQRPNDATDVLIDDVDPIPHPDDSKWRRKGQPRVFLGPIGSGNSLVKDAKFRDDLRKEHSIMAIEMEGAGLSDATWLQSCGYLIVRGTCDYCNQKKGDNWQHYAAIIAAGYARSVVEYLPPAAVPAVAAGFFSPGIDVKLDSPPANLAHFRFQPSASLQTTPVIDGKILEAAVHQLINTVTDAWKKLEKLEAIAMAVKLLDLVNQHENVLSAAVLREAFATLASSAAYKAVQLNLQTPDMSKAVTFIQRGKNVAKQ